MKYFVHVYHLVRSKFAVEADDHQQAMKKADELLGYSTDRLQFDAIGCVNTERDVVNGSASPVAMHLQTESADEVIHYLVDEVDDVDYERTQGYLDDGTVDNGQRRYWIHGRERDTILAALRYYQGAVNPSLEIEEIANNDHNNPLDLEEIDALCERLNV